MDDRHATRSFLVDAGPGLEPAVMLVPGVLFHSLDSIDSPGPSFVFERLAGPWRGRNVADIVRVRQVSGAIWWKPWTWFDVSFEVEGLGRNA